MNKDELTLLPWQQPLWDSLLERILAGRMPHALLLAGPQGLGKRHFARLLAAALLCEQPDAKGYPCGKCRACHLFSSDTHPDYRHIQPEEGKRSIGIEAVRELAELLSMKSHAGHHKVVLLEPADAMTPAAANALLKTLEEPTPGSYLLLCSDQPAALLPTIRSRCQKITFAVPPAASVLPWLAQQLGNRGEAELLLALSAGLPLRALTLAGEGQLATRAAVITALADFGEGRGEAVATAAHWHELGAGETLHWLLLALEDVARFKAGASEAVHNPDQVEVLRCLAERLDLVSLHRYLGKVQQALLVSRGPSNPQLLLEELLAGWPGAART